MKLILKIGIDVNHKIVRRFRTTNRLSDNRYIPPLRFQANASLHHIESEVGIGHAKPLADAFNDVVPVHDEDFTYHGFRRKRSRSREAAHVRPEA